MRIITSLILLITIRSSAQDSMILKSWDNLSKQLIYRANVVDKFGTLLSTDTGQINELKNASSLLKHKLNNSTKLDSLFIRDIKKQDKNVVNLLSRILTSRIKLMEIDSILKTNTANRNLQAYLEIAEVRVSNAQKAYNKVCESAGRKDLFYGEKPKE